MRVKSAFLNNLINNISNTEVSDRHRSTLLLDDYKLLTFVSSLKHRKGDLFNTIID